MPGESFEFSFANVANTITGDWVSIAVILDNQIIIAPATGDKLISRAVISDLAPDNMDLFRLFFFRYRIHLFSL